MVIGGGDGAVGFGAIVVLVVDVVIAVVPFGS